MSVLLTLLTYEFAIKSIKKAINNRQINFQIDVQFVIKIQVFFKRIEGLSLFEEEIRDKSSQGDP